MDRRFVGQRVQGHGLGQVVLDGDWGTDGGGGVCKVVGCDRCGGLVDVIGVDFVFAVVVIGCCPLEDQAVC